ncbi:MAG: hypothetical protein II508_06100, partial [Acholeplasmatales bacterium]|nr:hypothetical protein [Acholeplasmatales bacterium]
MRIKNMLLTVLSIFFLIVISSCGDSDIELAHLDYKEIEIEKPNFDVPKRNTKDEVTYSDLFNLGNQITVSIEMEDSELNKLQKDYESYKETYYKPEIYRHCKKVTITLKNYDHTFTWEFLDVGIRQKGNTSRAPILSDGKIVCLNHFKLSFDETFDGAEYGDERVDWSGKTREYNERINREFLGLSGIDLRWNKNYDSTHLREIYASYMYQASGLISQYMGLSIFNIKQIDQNIDYKMGVYYIYEPATKSMIKRHLTDKNIYNFGTWDEEKNGSFGVPNSKYGDLYKCMWSADLSYDKMIGERIGVEAKDHFVYYDRKTNKDAIYDDILLRKCGVAVSEGNYKDISKYLDVEYFAKTEAVSWLLGNPDDLRNNMNNTMVYARRTDGKVITIPIDNDRVLGITKDWNPDSYALSTRGIFNPLRAGNYENEVSLVYQKTILAEKNNHSKEMYLNHIKALSISDWVLSATFEKYYLMAKKNYNAYIDCAFPYLSVGFSLTDDNNQYSFKEYINRKLSLVDLDLELEDITKEEETKDLPTNLGMEGYYGSLYIAGDMNNWKGKYYKMTYEGNGVYTITFEPRLYRSKMYLKIYDGDSWYINWSIQNNNLIMYDTDAFTLENVYYTAKVTI